MVSTRKATERTGKTLDSTYANPDLEQVAANEIQLNSEDRTQLLGLLKYLGYLFYGTIGDWDTYTSNHELNIDSKPFSCK